MQQLAIGAHYLFKGFRLIQRKGIRHFAYLPILINTLLFASAIWYGVSHFAYWMSLLMPTWIPEWLASVLAWVLWPVFAALISAVVFFSFTIFANIIAAPFNGVLAEAVESSLLETTLPQQSWLDLVKIAPALLLNELGKIGYFALWMIPLFVFSWIPVLNIVAPVLWVLFSAWALALDYHDYPMGNHQLLFKQQRKIMRQHRRLALGFGLATLGATMIPVVNFLVIPAAVAGATALYLDKIKVSN
jgi:CysZ protein